jgi:hypothetical protein
MEYKIVEARYTHVLADKVNDEIKNGWRPQGAVCKDRVGEYLQAMIKE